MSTVVNVPKYDAICVNCGHTATRHTAKTCEDGAAVRNLGLALPPCGCSGWKRDEGWPPPLVISEASR